MPLKQKSQPVPSYTINIRLTQDDIDLKGKLVGQYTHRQIYQRGILALIREEEKV